jgi:Protein of unknown function (DUF3551)
MGTRRERYTQGERNVRLPVSLLLAGLGAIGLGLPTPAASQGRSPYSYPWCAMYNSGAGPGGARSCYYDSYEQCMTTLFGIGGLCVQSPYYHPPSGLAPRTAKTRRRHSF